MVRELDLIPEDYREFVFRIHLAKLTSACTAVFILVVFTFYLCNWQYYQYLKANIDQLEAEQAFTAKEKEKIASFESKHRILEQHLRLLDALSGHFSTHDIFAVVEKGLSGTDVWFERWKFERTREDVTHNKQADGYILEMPADEFNPRTSRWQLASSMSVVGKAKDHQTLSLFVTQLIAQPEVESVKVKRTSTSQVGNRELVSFHLSIILNNRARSI